MKARDKVHPSVQVDGDLLKRDRKEAGYTQVAFTAACESVSLVTVRRAEQGHRIINTSLERMASVLERSATRYIAHDPLDSATEYAVQLEGLWTHFFIEDDRDRSPYVIEETMTLRQAGSRVEGDTISHGLEGTRNSYFEATKVINNVLYGSTIIEDWPIPSGLTSFIQMASRNDDWLEGFGSWYDADSIRVETSRFIAVRQSSTNYQWFADEAKTIMERDLPLFRLRKLMEAGYSIDDAYEMLSVVSPKPGSKLEVPSSSVSSPPVTPLKIEGPES